MSNMIIELLSIQKEANDITVPQVSSACVCQILAEQTQTRIINLIFITNNFSLLFFGKSNNE